MKDELISKVMDEVMKKMGASDATSAPAAACCGNGSAACNLTEFVGTAIGHTIGLVIANVDHQIHEKMDIDPKYRSIGIIGDRTGAGPQIFAADEAVKATNCEIVKIELPRDTEGGAGHGSLIIFGAEDVSDARRAVEVCLREVERTMGGIRQPRRPPGVPVHRPRQPRPEQGLRRSHRQGLRHHRRRSRRHRRAAGRYRREGRHRGRGGL